MAFVTVMNSQSSLPSESLEDEKEWCGGRVRRESLGVVLGCPPEERLGFKVLSLSSLLGNLISCTEERDLFSRE